MKQPFTDTIDQAELAIQSAGDRSDVFNELLEGLGVGPVAGEILLGGINASPQTMKNAEQELAEEVMRRRQQLNAVQAPGEKGKRRKRPTMMRGMVI